MRRSVFRLRDTSALPFVLLPTALPIGIVVPFEPPTINGGIGVATPGDSKPVEDALSPMDEIFVTYESQLILRISSPLHATATTPLRRNSVDAIADSHIVSQLGKSAPTVVLTIRGQRVGSSSINEKVLTYPKSTSRAAVPIAHATALAPARLPDTGPVHAFAVCFRDEQNATGGIWSWAASSITTLRQRLQCDKEHCPEHGSGGSHAYLPNTLG